MTTYSTNNPLGSVDPRDLYDNAQNFDTAINSITAAIWRDRFGKTRHTWYGLEGMATQSISRIQEDGRRAIQQLGYVTLKSFQAGAPLPSNQLTLANQLLFDEVSQEYYRWDGAFPKSVPAGSTPASTGGIAVGAWLSVPLLTHINPDPHGSVVQAMVNGLPVKICVVGDSITNGLSATTPFPYRLGEILREWYNNPNIEIIKRGYSGEDTGQVLANHMAEIIADNADLYLIALGVNDARQDRGISVDDYEHSLMEMYRQLSFSAVSFCSLTDVVGLLATDITNPYAVNAYRSRMRHVAQLLGARYIDSFSIMQRYLFNRGDARGRLSRDRLHWNQAGYDLIAESIFIDGFAGVNLELQPGQFVDNTTAAYRGLNNVLNTLNCPYSVYVTTPANSVSKLFVFNTSLKPAYLVAHFAAELNSTAAIAGQVTVKNSVEASGRTYTLGIGSITGISSNFISEIPVSVCDLAPGLNIISFTTPADKVCRVVGFTVKQHLDRYTNAMQEKGKIVNKITAGLLEHTGNLQNTAFFRQLPFEVVGSLQSNGVNDTQDYMITSAFTTLIPRPYGETRFRIRGCFGTNSVLRFGCQIRNSSADTEWSANYGSVFALDFQGATTFMRVFSFTGTPINAASFSNARGDQCIDIVTSEAGTKFYVNGMLLWDIPIKLPECDLFASSSYNSLTEGMVIESVGEVGSAVAPNSVVPGERWFSHMDGKMHMVDKSGVHKTIQYA